MHGWEAFLFSLFARILNEHVVLVHGAKELQHLKDGSA